MRTLCILLLSTTVVFAQTSGGTQYYMPGRSDDIPWQNYPPYNPSGYSDPDACGWSNIYQQSTCPHDGNDNNVFPGGVGTPGTPVLGTIQGTIQGTNFPDQSRITLKRALEICKNDWHIVGVDNAIALNKQFDEYCDKVMAEPFRRDLDDLKDFVEHLK